MRQKIYKNILQLGNIDCINKFDSVMEELLMTFKDKYSNACNFLRSIEKIYKKLTGIKFYI